MRRVILRVVLSAFAVVLAVFLVVSCFIAAAMNDKPTANATVIILGCRVTGDGQPSLMLKNRIDTALKYLGENLDSVVIATGGKGDNELIPEADCIKNYLTENGISADRIFTETRSVNTYQNIQYSKEIIDKNALNTNVAIATSGFHMLRGTRFAKNAGLSVGAIPAKTPLYLLPYYWTREVTAILKWLPDLL